MQRRMMRIGTVCALLLVSALLAQLATPPVQPVTAQPAAAADDVQPGITTLMIPQVAAVPELDGVCASEQGYKDAAQVLVEQASVYLMHTTQDLWVCFDGLTVPASTTPDNWAAVYLDVNYSRDSFAQAGDLSLEVHVDGSMRARVGVGTGNYTPTLTVDGQWAGIYRNISREFPTRGAEFRISSELVGGWDRVIGLALAQHWITTVGDDRLWPFGAGYDRPDTWSAATLVVDAPFELRRRAAQLVEEMRFSEMAPGWDQARLGQRVTALYRPDLPGAAYYEFSVEVPAPEPALADTVPAGFIILATGEHDFPIPHWDSEGEPPTQRMAAIANQNDRRAVKFYKLDALAYAAEDEQGQLVAELGTPLAKVTGMDPAWLDEPVALGSAVWEPDQETTDDRNTRTISGTLRISGPEPPEELKIDGWESWSSLKQGYREAYGTLLEGLRREASEDWEIETNAARFGEILVKGDVYSITLLSALASPATLTGEGAAHVRTETIEREGLPALFQITVESDPGHDVLFDVTLNYGDGTSETGKFGIVTLIEPVEQPTVWLPLIINGSAPPAAVLTGELAASPAGAQLQSAWGPWTYYWAGTDSDQRLYTQIPANSPPNTSSCPSGCGATAWAMLFGWADNQAAIGNPTWVGRWGLYRENGGYGADAVAPRFMDTGVRNMTWEIRNRIGTFCAFGNGPTFPWRMSDASGYLAGRSGARIRTHYHVLGISTGGLRERARNSIRDRRTPAIIGTGWLNHYPLAYGYAWRSRRTWACAICPWKVTEYSRWFYVNQGHGGGNNGWVSASTWFAGELLP